MTAAEFTAISKEIPVLPGIYKYYNSADQLIYVGKAKHLRKRISSYFYSNQHNKKTIELVKKISKIEFTIVDNEQDAFLLENTLIKEYQPAYNIQLKDGKGYPYIVIKKEPFPRVFLTKRKIEDGAEYYGPYASLASVREIADFIRETIPLRTCTLPLTDKNIQAKKFKVCLEYHLGNCKGACQGLESAAEYANSIAQVKNILKGNLSPIIKEFGEAMKEYVHRMEFEKAAQYQQKIKNLQLYQAKSTVVNTKTGSVDVFSIVEEKDQAFVNYLAVNDGSIFLTKTITLQKKLEETKEEIFPFAIAQLRDLFKSQANEIIIAFPISFPQTAVKLTIPHKGDKKKLLDLSQKNADHFKKAFAAKQLLALNEKTTDEKLLILEQLQSDLQLSDIPLHIECFDNSNLHGTNAVAAMVCFKNGDPSKKDYRKFNIKTVIGIDDFASMKEIVYRRYKRVLDEQAALPQLIIIDGGKGQLSAAMESIVTLGLQGKVTVVGLAKNKEELFFPGDSESIQLAWNSDGLRLIRRIRDEVHRFGIGFHRNQRSRSAIQHELYQIKGIGAKTADLLLKEYKSIKGLKKIDLKTLESLIGKSKAAIVSKAIQQL